MSGNNFPDWRFHLSKSVREAGCPPQLFGAEAATQHGGSHVAMTFLSLRMNAQCPHGRGRRHSVDLPVRRGRVRTRAAG